MWSGFHVLSCAVVFLCLSYIVICPYTKVEESFNLQATHDLLYHEENLEEYDHLEFPGVVPRSFIGPWIVFALARPLTWVSHACGQTKMFSQFIVRAVLGLFVCVSLIQFCSRLYTQFGRDVAVCVLLLTSTQFHFLFYASRPLPNTFALILVLLAYSSWLGRNTVTFIWLAAMATIIFRSELAILFGLLVFQELLRRKITIGTVLKYGIPAGIVSLGLTVLVDSHYWKRWLWPEGEVFWYNTVENKSSQWGTEPFFWYFYSALPRAMTFSVLLVPFGVYWDRRVHSVVWPTFGFILAYSFLPHKELRFIIYTIPILNVAAAVGLTRIWHNYHKLPATVSLSVMAGLLLSSGFTACQLRISRYNYPGGEAFSTLHSMINSTMDHSMSENCNITVHISVEAAQTGVSRYGELRPHWRYFHSKLTFQPTR
ncbi:dol-P-Man:Man(7)GlcNAc(2)-PP-Dol alpha-1,6-mannosyltransferase-like isoform X2 [Dysidea avara]|uniref:dol-P-Man:Man(7)GlcNAc(2)-PP-Dol alpha-1,6-mannosyltransferase-like isoform X2 n=1 Tax=Dysidea avara TaxID=196820 RepID=UPI0033321AD5